MPTVWVTLGIPVREEALESLALESLGGALVAFHNHNSTDHAAGPDVTDDPLAGVIRWSQGRGRPWSPPDAALVTLLLCTALTAEHGWTLTSTSVQPAASPELKWLNRETDDASALRAGGASDGAPCGRAGRCSQARLLHRVTPQGEPPPRRGVGDYWSPRCRYAQAAWTR